jgi:hypothetical protein
MNGVPGKAVVILVEALLEGNPKATVKDILPRFRDSAKVDDDVFDAVTNYACRAAFAHVKHGLTHPTDRPIRYAGR